jgi:hypothetical protein
MQFLRLTYSAECGVGEDVAALDSATKGHCQNETSWKNRKDVQATVERSLDGVDNLNRGKKGLSGEMRKHTFVNWLSSIKVWAPSRESTALSRTVSKKFE